MDGWMDGWLVGYMDESMDGWMDWIDEGWMDGCGMHLSDQACLHDITTAVLSVYSTSWSQQSGR